MRYADFRRRFLALLSFQFREFGSATALSVLEAVSNTEQRSGRAPQGKSIVRSDLAYS